MTRWAVLIFLTVVGTLQMAGDLLRLPALKAVAAATGASPAPKVFTAQSGFETYSSRFYLDWLDRAGHRHSFEITPENYSGLRGPYNRRNAYGAAVSYGPVLVANPHTAAMFQSVARYGICGQAPLLRELGLDPQALAASPRLRLVPRSPPPATQHWQLEFQVNCDE